MKTSVSELSNGVRVVTCSMREVQSVAVGIWASVGARHEPARLNGISHFIEHMLFKGTARRSARRIMQEIEGIGGDINANTSEERTCYHAAAPAEYLPKICDVLCDIYLHPRLAQRDIELERAVIAEEILMYRDEPSQHVHELLNGAFWRGHALGRPITGTLKSIGGLRREDFHQYRQTHYHGGSTVVSAAGAVDHGRFVELLEKHLGGLPRGAAPRSRPAPTPNTAPKVVAEQRDIQQTQLAIAFPAPHYHDERRFAANLLHVILGGNASSRLFQDLRERRGYCYSVATYPLFFSDTGMFNITTGLDGKNLEASLRIMNKHFAGMREKLCGETELRRAKEYVIGVSRMSMERTSTQNSRIAQSLLSFGKILDPEEMHAKTRAVTARDVREVARWIFRPRRAAAAIIGPAAEAKALRPLFHG